MRLVCLLCAVAGLTLGVLLAPAGINADLAGRKHAGNILPILSKAPRRNASRCHK